jgi:hypothetical protein
MNCFFAAALRWIFPLPARGATVDFFGTDVVDFFETEDLDDAFAELLFDFDGVLLTDEDRRVEDREEKAPWLASEPTGSSRSAAIRIQSVRVRMAANY